MRCTNSDCPDPRFIERIGVKVSFCPACGIAQDLRQQSQADGVLLVGDAEIKSEETLEDETTSFTNPQDQVPGRLETQDGGLHSGESGPTKKPCNVTDVRELSAAACPVIANTETGEIQAVDNIPSVTSSNESPLQGEDETASDTQLANEDKERPSEDGAQDRNEKQDHGTDEEVCRRDKDNKRLKLDKDPDMPSSPASEIAEGGSLVVGENVHIDQQNIQVAQAVETAKMSRPEITEPEKNEPWQEAIGSKKEESCDTTETQHESSDSALHSSSETPNTTNTSSNGTLKPKPPNSVEQDLTANAREQMVDKNKSEDELKEMTAKKPSVRPAVNDSKTNKNEAASQPKDAKGENEGEIKTDQKSGDGNANKISKKGDEKNAGNKTETAAGYFYQKPKLELENTKGAKDKDKQTNKADASRGARAESETYFSESTPPGATPKGTRMVTIVFHALLAPHFQFDKSRGDRVAVRGAGPFKGWYEDQLEMMPISDTGDGYVLIKGETKIPFKAESRKISYKYIVVKWSDDKKKSTYLWEDLIGFVSFAGKHVNRCFIIPEDRHKQDCTWHQYDDAIFPQLSRWENWYRKLPVFKSMDPLEGCEFATIAMLPEWDSFGVEDAGSKIKGCHAMENINQVVYCMKNAKLDDNGNVRDRHLNNFSLNKVLFGYMEQGLRNNIISTQTTNEEDIQAHRLATSLAIVSMAVTHEINDLRDEPLKELFECLVINTSVGQKKSRVFEILTQYYPKKHWRRFADVLLQLCKYTIGYYHGVNEWLLAVPLLHFLSEVSAPYDNNVENTDPASQDTKYWGTCGLQLDKVRSISLSSPVHLLVRLQSMFELDPLLRRTFLFALPVHDLGKVVEREMFPTHEVCWTLARVLQENGYLTEDKRASIRACLDAMITAVPGTTEEQQIHESVGWYASIEELKSLVRASMHVLDYSLVGLRDKFELMCGTLSLLAKALCWIQQTSQHKHVSVDDNQATQDKINASLCENCLREASVKVRSCLEKTFQSNLSLDFYKDEEIQVWSTLLSIEITDKELRILWQKGLMESLNQRIHKMDYMERVKLYTIKDLSIYHDDVEACFREAAFDAVKHIVEVGLDADHTRTFSNLCLNDPNSSQARNVGEMMSLLLRRSWPKPTNGMELEQLDLLRHLLSWSPLVQYLRYFERDAARKQILSVDGQMLLTLASTCLDEIKRKVDSASIRVQTLRLLYEKKERFLELLEVMKERNNDTQLQRKNEEKHEAAALSSTQWITRDDPATDLRKQIFNDTRSNLQRRLDELRAFQEEKERVLSFMSISSEIQNVRVDTLKSKAHEDVSKQEIRNIAVHVDAGGIPSVNVIFFGLSDKLKRMVYDIHQLCESSIFRDVWRLSGEKAQQFSLDEEGPTMSLEEIEDLVWSRTKTHCLDLLDNVISGEISLRDVDKAFDKFRWRYEELRIELFLMAEVFRSQYDNLSDVIGSQIKQVERYQRLQQCVDAAEIICEFKEEMGLHGNFNTVEEFRIQARPQFKRRPLNSVTDELLETGQVLESMTEDRLKCLEAVVESKDFIQWLKDSMKGMENQILKYQFYMEVRFLVDLAMISAGEGDIESDRIAALHTCALGFSPLIFQLQNSDGFDELMTLCNHVWSSLETNPDLPKQLCDTSRRLDWLKNVKEFHGSVAMSSLQQVENINERGKVRVGYTENGGDVGLNTAICLTLRKENEDLQKESYSMEELKDLQSKLMLIAGKTAGKKEHVEKLSEIIQGVERLATVYSRLCETGEVSHLEWCKEFSCRDGKEVIMSLHRHSEELEGYLEAWQAILDSKRMMHNQLNQFTAQQLLFLRKELADLRRGYTLDSLELQVYALLESVLPGVDVAALRKALISIGIDVEMSDVDFEQELRVTHDERMEDVCDEENLREKYKKFFLDIEKLELTEQVALAAIVACRGDADEADMIIWSIKNKDNEDVIEEMCNRGARNPHYACLFPRTRTGDSGGNDSESDDEDASEGSAMDTLKFEDEHRAPLEKSFVSNLDQTAGGAYLSLDELGTLLSTLAHIGEDRRYPKMRFPPYLKEGKPNLILAPQADIFATVIGLYRESETLPSRHEVLICTEDTSLEEIELLWRHALADIDKRAFYCLVNADLLSYTISKQAVNRFESLSKEPPYDENEEYRLVVVCSSEREDRAYIVSALDEFRVGGAPRCPRPNEVLSYLKEQFQPPNNTRVSFKGNNINWISAADIVDKERVSVKVISSNRAGTGKSLIVHEYAKRVEQLGDNGRVLELLEAQGEHVTPLVTIPLHGKTLNLSDTTSFLLPYALKSDVPLSRIFHFDVSSSVTSGLDTILFNLLVLGSLQDKHGRVWRRNPRDLYLVEIIETKVPKNDARPLLRSLRAGPHLSQGQFYEQLPRVQCITPSETLQRLCRDTGEEEEIVSLFNESEFQCEAVQRVFQYLRLFDENPQFLHEFQFRSEQLTMGAADCLQLLIGYCGVQDPSWAELRHFVNFLNYQLRDCENSVFCDMENVGDILEGFRVFVVRFMTIMSQDFSTRSLKEEAFAARARHDEGENKEGEGDITRFQLRRRWETNSHPYMFFNPDHTTFTFLGFRIDPDGNLIDSSTGEMIEKGLMTRHLRTGLHVQRVDMDTNFEDLTKADKISKMCAVMGVEWPYDPDETYELTEDNVKKMLAIHMRFRCGIPVVVMGETGCGKTRLVRYLCGLQSGPGGPRNMLLVKIHGGTSFNDIESKVLRAKEMASENRSRNIDTVLFFDEVNTTEALSLVKEVMVDRRLNGQPLGPEADRLQFIAACNPYKKHTEHMIRKLESAGLGYNVKADESLDRLGRIPLRHLVYRVHALPESMLPLVWDFGQLTPEVEELYTRQIVRRHVIVDCRIPGDEMLVDAITSILAASQQHMRQQTDECSFVSLRDVERVMNVMVWFYEHQDVFAPLLVKLTQEDGEHFEMRSDEDAEISPISAQFVRTTSPESDTPVMIPAFLDVGREMEHELLEDRNPRNLFSDEGDDENEDSLADSTNEQNKSIDPVTWSLVLALGVCYHAKLQDRNLYRQVVSKAFRQPCRLSGGPDRILQEITRCQRAVLNEIDLGPNIARNTALRENVFMMVVCIDLRIPLFVVGKPGSSKSLAKTVVAGSMQGNASKSDLFKSFKEVQMSAHQCSPLSTPEGIMETFRQCKKLQKDKNPDAFVSVVVLDEVGLAEDSPLMPLKTLHPLLEDGVTSSDDVLETDEKPIRVAFIGISNWALDPAKMNRGIMLSRDVPNKKELEDSAMGICATDEVVKRLVSPLIPALSQGYSEVYESQKNVPALREAKKDEFFGLRDFYSLVKMVYSVAKEKERQPDWREIEYAVRRNFDGLDMGDLDPVEIFMKHLQVPKDMREAEQDAAVVSSLSLIRTSLNKDPSEENSRYLLILTENHAALRIVQQHFLDKEHDAVLIFGSSFPKDLEYTQVCRNINRIKVCMETGRTVILLNMESLYEGLYDALNQYYVEFGGTRYVDLGLGTHRVKCRVDKNFRLIVIAEKDTVYKEFPIPLINRLEKHVLVLSTSLTPAQDRLVRIIRTWVDRFSEVVTPLHQRTRNFKEGDAFVGYHADTVPSVVLQVCGELREDGNSIGDYEIPAWEEKVLSQSKQLLVQCCTPDAITRLQSSRLSGEARELFDLYFHRQEHSTLASFLSSAKRELQHEDGLLVQVSTHSRLLSSSDMNEVAVAVNLLPRHTACITLQQFQTEQQFCSCVGNFFAKLGGQEGLLIVQCDPGDQTFNLLACARRHLMEERSSTREELDDTSPIHIVVIIQLPRILGGYRNFVGFQGGRWLSVHIDELCTPLFHVPSVECLVNKKLSDLFDVSNAPRMSKTIEEQTCDVVNVLRQSVQAAAGRIDDDEGTVARATKRIVILLGLLPSDQSMMNEADGDSFSSLLVSRVHELLTEKDTRAAMGQASAWSLSEALQASDLQESGTFRKALWLRIQTAVVPILAELIAYMDRDGNLDLLMNDLSWLTDLWLRFLKETTLTELHYGSFLSESGSIRDHVPVLSSGRGQHVFQCRFPFSWLVKEKIDSMWKDASSVAASSNKSIEECLRGMIGSSDIGSLMDAINTREAMERYLHDFVHMTYEPVMEGEDELICRAVLVTAKQLHVQSVYDEDYTCADIALIHKAHTEIEQRLACFSKLVRCQSEIVAKLLESFSPDENEMTLDVDGLQMCLEGLEPTDKELVEQQNTSIWCGRVLAIRATVESIIGRTYGLEEEQEDQLGEKSEAILDHCRHMWERLSAVRLFIEHVLPPEKSSNEQLHNSHNIVRLWKALGDHTDFSSAESITVVERFLVECSEASRERQRLSADATDDFLLRCNSFFMELISLFCFGGQRHAKPLRTEVFEIFMRYITGSESARGTKNFSPFPDFDVDRTPVVRSFLLQQLLTKSEKEVKQHLKRYLYEAQGLSSDRCHVIRVCQLTIQCMEDSLARSIAKGSLDLKTMIGITAKMISDAGKILSRTDTETDELDVDTLEAVAKARYSLTLTAEMMHKSCVTDGEEWQTQEIQNALGVLFGSVREACSLITHRTPLIYLLKQLTRRYGGGILKDIARVQHLSWAIPYDFRARQGDAAVPDRFTVYGEHYQTMRDVVARSVLSVNFDELPTNLQQSDFSPAIKDVLVLLSLYREVTCGQREQGGQEPQETRTHLENFFHTLRNLTAKARPLATQLLRNTQGMGFAPLTVAPDQPRGDSDLAEVVIHTMVVLQCADHHELIETLRNLMFNPAQMMQSYLPTMPEDSFQEVRKGLTEDVRWYVCPRGHRYSIGDCGRADQKAVCPECKLAIGGIAYELVADNRILANPQEDRSSQGHILGNPSAHASSAGTSDRNLSPAVVCIIRLIMHSAMLTGGCRHPKETNWLISPQVHPDQLHQFLWQHLSRDLRALAAAINKSADEALLVVHLVLSRIATHPSTSALLFGGDGILDTPAARRQWEIEFSAVFINPVLSNLDEHLQRCLTVLVEDKRLGNDPLMREIYEIDKSEADDELTSMNAVFWRYRAQITVEHAKQQFQEKMANEKNKTCKVLDRFFSEEYRLRAVRYLPDVVRLQKLLMERFYRRLGKKEDMTIREVFQQLRPGPIKQELEGLFKSFKAAWGMVREHLENQGRYRVPSELCSVALDNDTPLATLLPTTSGRGVCSTALVFYLVTTHNEFVETFLNITQGKASNANHVPLTEVTGSQLVSYDVNHDLLPLILAHCHYSLEVGRGTCVDYDWSALQRQLVDRWIRGRPLIDFEEIKFTFGKNIQEDNVFTDLRTKIKQERLPRASSTHILSEIRRLTDVCDVKSNLEIAIGFLSSAGGQADMLVSDYMHKVLHMPKESGLKSREAHKLCKLSHIVHLWQLLTLQRAKILFGREEDPFEDIPDRFKSDMPQALTGHFSKSLRKLDVELLLLDLTELITVNLKESEARREEASLNEYLLWYMKRDGDENDELKNIPDDVLLKHVTNAWGVAVESTGGGPKKLL